MAPGPRILSEAKDSKQAKETLLIMEIHEVYTNRHKQTFRFKACEILPTAEAKMVMHDGRIEHWTAEHKKASDALVELGPVDTTMQGKAMSYSNAPPQPGNSSDYEKTVLAYRLEQDRSRAANKVSEHKAAREVMSRFVRAFKLFSDKVVKLTVDDIHYFQL